MIMAGWTTVSLEVIVLGDTDKDGLPDHHPDMTPTASVMAAKILLVSAGLS